MMDSLGIAGTFFFFAGCTFVGLIVFMTMMKETRGLSKEELAVLYLPNELKDKL